MDSDNREMLGQVFCNVAEAVAFMFGDVVEVDDLPAAPEDAMCAKMEFSGPFRGSLLAAVPTEMCPQIAANVLGVEPDDEGVFEKAADALKELLNVTCGQVLTSLAGEEPVFDLTVPQVTNMDAEGWESLAADLSVVAVILDDNPVLLKVSIEA